MLLEKQAACLVSDFLFALTAVPQGDVNKLSCQLDADKEGTARSTSRGKHSRATQELLQLQRECTVKRKEVQEEISKLEAHTHRESTTHADSCFGRRKWVSCEVHMERHGMWHM